MADDADTAADASPLASLREPVENPHGFGGYGPLLALAVLVVLMVFLAPTIAPEEIVLVPTDDAPTTTVDLTP
jgi:hypothetical protein